MCWSGRVGGKVDRTTGRRRVSTPGTTGRLTPTARRLMCVIAANTPSNVQAEKADNWVMGLELGPGWGP